jgi:hypothetical protein
VIIEKVRAANSVRTAAEADGEESSRHAINVFVPLVVRGAAKINVTGWGVLYSCVSL